MTKMPTQIRKMTGYEFKLAKRSEFSELKTENRKDGFKIIKGRVKGTTGWKVYAVMVPITAPGKTAEEKLKSYPLGRTLLASRTVVSTKKGEFSFALPNTKVLKEHKAKEKALKAKKKADETIKKHPKGDKEKTAEELASTTPKGALAVEAKRKAEELAGRKEKENKKKGENDSSETEDKDKIDPEQAQKGIDSIEDLL